MRYRLRTLLIALALLPPLLAGGYWQWGRYVAWRERQKWEREQAEWEAKQRAEIRAAVLQVFKAQEALGGGMRALTSEERERLETMLELPPERPAADCNP
jgi:hypothetical protein